MDTTGGIGAIVLLLVGTIAFGVKKMSANGVAFACECCSCMSCKFDSNEGRPSRNFFSGCIPKKIPPHNKKPDDTVDVAYI